MASIVIKHVYDPPAKADGKRVLVDRLWPRGLRKADAALDDWWKELAPSRGLRTWFGHDPERFGEFKKRYVAELKANPQTRMTAKELGPQRLTLLYGAKDPAVNHAVVLATMLKRFAK